MQIDTLLVLGILEMAEANRFSESISHFHEGTVILGAIINHDSFRLAQEFGEFLLGVDRLGRRTNLRQAKMRYDKRAKNARRRSGRLVSLFKTDAMVVSAAR